jgi:hypothetical protein
LGFLQVLGITEQLKNVDAVDLAALAEAERATEEAQTKVAAMKAKLGQ